MEKKTKQRIIGGVVVGTLAILLLPLLFSTGNNVPIQEAIAKTPVLADSTPAEAPPTPEQINDAATKGNVDISSNMANSITGSEVYPNTPSTTDSAQTTSPASASTETPAAPIPAQPQPIASTSPASDTKDDAKKKVVSAKSKTTKLISHHQASNIKSSAWVIQMGSFKNKNNAKRLANQLRSQGYKAFTKTIKSTHGESVRVYVGPEFKQASASSLAGKIQQKMNMQGIVMFYNPLEI